MKDLKKFLGVCAFLFVLICVANSLYALYKAEQEKYLRELKQKREKAE